jgi:hypothetical protein
LAKIGKVLVCPRTKECDLGVSVSSTPVGYGGKDRVGENWDQKWPGETEAWW